MTTAADLALGRVQSGRARPTVVLNAYAIRGGGASGRLAEVARKAPAIWGADIVVVRNRETHDVPGVRSVTAAPAWDRLGAWGRRLAEPRLLRRAAHAFGATAIIHYGSYVPVERLPGVRNVLFFVNLAPWDPGRGRNTLRNRLLRRLFNATIGRADLLIAQSASTLEILREKYPNLPVPTAVVHNGCSLPELTRSPVTRDFVAVGHVYRYRRLESVVRAYAALPADIRRRHRLVVIGHVGRDGDAVSAVRREIDRLGLHEFVVLRGALPRVQALEAVANACAFVSFAAVDNGPNAVAEAVALDVRLVLSDIPVHRELAGGVAQLAADEAALALGMEKAARSPQSGSAGPRAALNTWGRHVAQVGELLDRIGGLPR